MAERVTVARLGASGDGVAELPDGPVYVPGTLPGEVVIVERESGRTRVLSRETSSPDRVEPFCPYYDRCGGCVAQHVGASPYRDWKRGKLQVALERAGIEHPVEPLQDAHGDGRRRVTLHAHDVDGTMRVGFMEAKSHRLVEIARCPITVPALADAPEAASALASRMKGVGKPLDIAVTATREGLDVDIRGSGPVGEVRRQSLIAEAGSLRLARLSLHGDVLVELNPPVITMGKADMRLPPGGFLQATEAGEAALSAAVVEACRGAKRVADLFAGTGPFSMRLAESAEVHAVEADGRALAALDRAARAAAGLRRVTTETRDLFRRPLLPPELARFDAVVLDPPRAGAEAQVRQLALAPPRTVGMVSCDPGTFARDAATLVGAGFAVERILPVDQFKWSAHLEIVGVFRSSRSARRGGRGNRTSAVRRA